MFADYYAPASQLVTANYDSNTITIINVSLDQYGNDSTLFGQAVTVPVGNGPATLTILRDGSRVYVANQKDSTVSVVSLTSYQVLATIPVTGHPISIASTFSTPYGQVYVLPSDQAYMSVIRTDTDQVAASIQLDGNGVDVHTSAQTVAANAARQARLRMPSTSVMPAVSGEHPVGTVSGAICYAPQQPLPRCGRSNKSDTLPWARKNLLGFGRLCVRLPSHQPFHSGPPPQVCHRPEPANLQFALTDETTLRRSPWDSVVPRESGPTHAKRAASLSGSLRKRKA